VFSEVKAFSGALAAAIGTAPIPVFSPWEIARYEDASDDRLRTFPPVAIEPTGLARENANAPIRDLISSAGATLLGDDVVTIDRMPQGVRRAFSRLQKVHLALIQRADYGLAELPEGREPYHVFATEFFKWYATQPANEKSRRHLPRAFYAPSLFSIKGDQLAMLLAPPSQVAFDAILAKKSEWDGNVYRGVNAEVSLVDSRPDAPPVTEEKRRLATAVMLQLDDRDAQSLAFAFAHIVAGNQGRDIPQRVRFHVNDALDFREFKRTRGDYRPEQKREECERWLRLSSLWVGVRDRVPMRGKKRRTKVVNAFSRLIELTVENETGEDAGAPISLLPDVPPQKLPYAFRVAFGSWADEYWEGSRRLAPMFAKILSYDPRKNAERIALRVALYLTFSGGSFRGTVATLLMGAHIEPPKRNPEMFRTDFEDALGRLRDDKGIGSYAYDEFTAAEGRGWSLRWLATIVTVQPLQTTLTADPLIPSERMRE
jgi:hypothetical protein